MDSKITYHQQISYCRKPRCRKCREGIGHGPYWYAYKTVEGRTMRTYIGKNPPPEVQATHTQNNVDTPSQDQPSQAVLRIFTFGQFRLERPAEGQWQEVSDTAWMQTNYVRALLARLICSPERKVSREQAMELLSPSGDKARGASALNKTLKSLRKVLGKAHEGQIRGGLLRSEGDELILADQASIWIDATAFEDLLARSTATNEAPLQPGEPAYQERMATLHEAAALYKGDFLPEGLRHSWVNTRRQELRRAWIQLLLEQADLYLNGEESGPAIEVLNRLLANDPANEAAVQRLIIILARLKRRGEAIRAYQRLTAVLQRDGKREPSEETQDLFQAVRQGQEMLTLPRSSIASEASATRPQSPSHILSEQAIKAVQAVQVGRANQSPLVGRNYELDTLQRILVEVEQSKLATARRGGHLPLDTQRRPQCVVLKGEIGIGKTRLAEEISRIAQTHNWAAVQSRVSPQESMIPYRLWTEALRRVLYVGSGLIPALYERRWSEGQETSTMLNMLQPLTALLPELSEMLPPGSTPTISFAPETKQDQLRLWQAMRDLLVMISEQTRLLLVLDDIQWADVNSCDLLGYLCRHLIGHPILLVATCRETELGTNPPHPLRVLISHMQREHSVMTLDVTPLTDEQIGLLVSEVSRLPSSMVQYIQDHAAGNPLFAEEMARLSPPMLSKNVTAALEQRMHRLSASCQELLRSAAVLGGSFEFPLIYEMSERGGQSDEDAVLNLLEEALQSGVLTEEGMGTRITYHFWHPLLVNHLYENIFGVRRARLHQRAAEALQHLYAGREEEVAATITRHLEQAGAESLRIAHYAELAGHHAYTLSAYKEAAQHYEVAIARRDQASVGENADAQVELAHQLYLLERLAECVMIRGPHKEARALYERVLRLRQRLQVTDARYEAQVIALLWSEIAWTWRYETDSAQGWHCCRLSEKVLNEAGIVGGPTWARIHHLQSNLYILEGRFDEARQAALEELAFFEAEQTRPTSLPHDTRSTRIQRILASDPVDRGRVYRRLGTIAAIVGQRSQALNYFETALNTYERYDYKREVAHVSCDMGYNYLKRAEDGLARAALNRAFSLARSINDDPLISVVYSNLGELAAVRGDIEEAEQAYKYALEQAERTNDREYQSRWNAALALLLQEQGKQDEAATCACTALVISRIERKDPCVGEALVALGRIRIMQASKAERLPLVRRRLLEHARKDLQRALDLPGLEAATRTQGQLALAQAAYELDESSRARDELQQALEMAQRYEMAREEAQARKLISEL